MTRSGHAQNRPRSLRLTHWGARTAGVGALGGEGGARVVQHPDARVHDLVALDEIELCTELIIAASSSDGPLSQEQIDAVLGLGVAPVI